MSIIIIYINDQLPMQLIVIRSIIHHYKLVWSSMISLTFVNSYKVHVLHQLMLIAVR